MIDPRLVDHAKAILQDAPLDLATKASAWDHWHDARDAQELSTRLAEVEMPDHIAQKLIEAKRLSMPKPDVTPVDKATAAINRLAQIDKTVLDLAEKHPTVARALIEAAVKAKN